MSVAAQAPMASGGAAPARRAPLLDACCTSWVVTVDHKRLGIMYVGAGLVFLVVAGLEAA